MPFDAERFPEADGTVQARSDPREAEMERYDIFKSSEDGTVCWVDAVENVEQARTRVEELTQRSAGDYFIFDQYMHATVANNRPDPAGKHER
jgi:hypothetical protein